MRPRLYLDEDISPLAAAALRNRGFDVVSAHDSGLLGVDDAVQLEQAAQESRAILSFNHTDFTRLAVEWLQEGRSHHGIVISYRQYSRTHIGGLIAAIQRLLTQVDASELNNTLRTLDDFRSAST